MVVVFLFMADFILSSVLGCVILIPFLIMVLLKFSFNLKERKVRENSRIIPQLELLPVMDF